MPFIPKKEKIKEKCLSAKISMEFQSDENHSKLGDKISKTRKLENLNVENHNLANLKSRKTQNSL